MTGETQPIIRIVEVLPAPFGPRKPKDSPGATSKSIASTAVNAANRFVRPRAWIRGGAGLGAGLVTGRPILPGSVGGVTRGGPFVLGPYVAAVGGGARRTPGSKAAIDWRQVRSGQR